MLAGKPITVPMSVSAMPMIAAQPHSGTRASVENASLGEKITLRLVARPFACSGGTDAAGESLMTTPFGSRSCGLAFPCDDQRLRGDIDFVDDPALRIVIDGVCDGRLEAHPDVGR